jgi:hypothetical protein
LEGKIIFKQTILIKKINCMISQKIL